MKNFVLLLTFLFYWSSFGQEVVTGPQGVRVREIDLSPGGTARVIEVSNSSLQNLGGGVFRITTGGSGGAVLVNGTTITDPNLTNSSTIVWVVGAATNISAYTTNLANANIIAAAAIDATKIADGSVTSAEFQRIDFTSSGQTQMDTKAPIASPTFTGNPAAPTASAGDNDTSIATTAFTTAALANLKKGTISADFRGSLLVANQVFYKRVPYAGTITGWYIYGDSGSGVFDVWLDTTRPNVSDSVAGSEKPTLSSATDNNDTNLTTWTDVAVAEGDWIAIHCDSTSTSTWITVDLLITKN